MTSVIRLTFLVILRMNHPRIWVPPTPIQKLSINFKIEFPESRTKILISSESAWLTESDPFFRNRKKRLRKKVMKILIPGIHPTNTISMRSYKIWLENFQTRVLYQLFSDLDFERQEKSYRFLFIIFMNNYKLFMKVWAFLIFSCINTILCT